MSTAPNQPVPDEQLPQFTTVSRGGLHPQEVYAHIRHLLGRIAHLEGQLLGKVVEEAHTPQGEKMIADLLRIAVDQITAHRDAEEAAIAQLRADGEAEAARITGNATAEAQSIVAGAREQANSVLNGARADAKKMTDTAAAQSAAVSEGAGRRLGSMQDLHAQTISRLQEVRDVVGKYLDAEDRRGSLEDDVNRVLPAGMAVAASISVPAEVEASAAPQLTASAENGASGK